MRVVTVVAGLVFLLIIVGFGYWMWGGSLSSSSNSSSVTLGDTPPIPQWGRNFGGGRGARQDRGQGQAGNRGNNAGSVLARIFPSWTTRQDSTSQDQLEQLISTLQDLNLTPAFDLTKEQKEKIAAIREANKTALAKWEEAHAADFKALNAESEKLTQGGTPAELEALAAKRKAIWATVPKEADALQQIKGVLTEAQAKAINNRTGNRGGGANAGEGRPGRGVGNAAESRQGRTGGNAGEGRQGRGGRNGARATTVPAGAPAASGGR